MTCDDRIEQISALLDGELAAPDLAPLTAHIAACPACARTLAELGGLRTGLADAVPEEPVSAAFEARIERLLRNASRPPSRRLIVFPSRSVGRRAAWLGVGAALAALILLAVWPRHDESLDLGGVRDAALRGTVTVTADVGAVPAVPGYRMVAARADVIAGHRARVLVYAQGEARITLCLWPAGHEPPHPVRRAVYQGMDIRYWNDGRQEFWAASADAGQGLQVFVAALTGHPV